MSRDHLLAERIIRMPSDHAAAVKALAKRTRIPIASYYREAIEDLLRKYGALPVADQHQDREARS